MPQITTGMAVLFLLLLTRVTAMLGSSPFFSNQTIPNRLKLLLGIGISIILFPIHAMSAPTLGALPHDLPQLLVMVAQELSIGLILGFAANMMFSGMQMTGEFISMQMGLSISNVLDPATHTNVPLIGQMYFYFGMMVFLSLNFHHGLLIALNNSFHIVPLGQSWLLPGLPHDALAHTIFAHPGLLVDRVILMSGNIFVLALMLAVPMMGLLLITEIGLGLVARVMPQMNIFVVGLPLKVMLGIFGMMATVPGTADLLAKYYTHMLADLLLLLTAK